MKESSPWTSKPVIGGFVLACVFILALIVAIVVLQETSQSSTQSCVYTAWTWDGSACYNTTPGAAVMVASRSLKSGDVSTCGPLTKQRPCMVANLMGQVMNNSAMQPSVDDTMFEMQQTLNYKPSGGPMSFDSWSGYSDFSVRFFGSMLVPTTGLYKFVVSGNGRTRLIINSLIEASNEVGSSTTRSISLSSDTALTFQFEYTSLTGPPSFAVQWIVPNSFIPTDIPTSVFYHDPAGLDAVVFKTFNGLAGFVYTSVDFSGSPAATFAQTSPISSFIGTALLQAGSQSFRTFGLQFVGYITIPTTGLYQFTVGADNRVRLYINGDLVVDQWVNQPYTETTTSAISLTAGSLANIVLEYYHPANAASWELRWTLPSSSASVVIPSSTFSHSPDVAWTYSSSFLPDVSFTQNASILINLADGVPFVYPPFSSSIEFAVRYTGYLRVPVDGAYTFNVTCDDVAILLLNNQAIISNWIVDSLNSKSSAPVNLLASESYPIELRYGQDSGAAFLSLAWKSELFAQQLIPSIYFSRVVPLTLDQVAVSPQMAPQVLAFNDNPSNEVLQVPDLSVPTPPGATPPTVSIPLEPFENDTCPPSMTAGGRCLSCATINSTATGSDSANMSLAVYACANCPGARYFVLFDTMNSIRLVTNDDSIAAQIRQNVTSLKQRFPHRIILGGVAQEDDPDPEAAAGGSQMCLAFSIKDMSTVESRWITSQFSGIDVASLFSDLPPELASTFMSMIPTATGNQFVFPVQMPSVFTNMTGSLSDYTNRRRSGTLDTVLGYMMPYLSPETGIFQLNLGTFTLNNIPINAKLNFYLMGVGVIFSNGFNFLNLIDSVIPGDPAQWYLDNVTPYTQFLTMFDVGFGTLINNALTANLRLVTIKTNNGDTQPGSVLLKLPNNPDGVKKPVLTSIKEVVVNMVMPGKLTLDLFISIALATPANPVRLIPQIITDLYDADSILKLQFDNVALRLQYMNILNSQAIKRDYCRKIALPKPFNGYNGHYRYEMPPARFLALEVAAQWVVEDFVFEVAIRRDQGESLLAGGATREQRCAQYITKDCYGDVQSCAKYRSETDDLIPTLALPNTAPQKHTDTTSVIVRFPRLRLQQIICLCRGIPPNMKSDSGSSNTACSRVLDEYNSDPAAKYALTFVGMLMLTAPSGNGGRNTPLLALNFDGSGPQITIMFNRGASTTMRIEAQVQIGPIPEIPLDLRISFGKLKAALGRRETRAAASSGMPMNFGFGFPQTTLGSIINTLLPIPGLSDMIALIGGDTKMDIGLMVASADVDQLANPSMALDADVFRRFQVIPKGVTLGCAFSLPSPCGSNGVCRFIKETLAMGDPSVNLYVNFGADGASVQLGASLANLVLQRDSCTVNVPQGRPTVSLTEVGIYGQISPSLLQPVFGFRVALTLDVGKLRQSNTLACYVQELLTFRGMIQVKPTGLTIGVAMVGIWQQAFGLSFISFGDLSLLVGMSYVIPWLTRLQMGGTVALGENCYVADAGGNWVFDTSATCVQATGNFGIDVQEPGNNFVQFALYGFTVRNLVRLVLTGSLRTTMLNNFPAFLLDTGFPTLPPVNGQPIPNPSFSFSANPFGITTMAGLYIPGGVYLKGRLNFLGWVCDAEVIVNPTSQIYVNITMDPIQFGPITLQRSPSDATHGPRAVILAAFMPPNFGVSIQGHGCLFGLCLTINVTVSPLYYDILLKGLFLFPLIPCDIHITLSLNFKTAASNTFMASISISNTDEIVNRVRAQLDKAFTDAKQALNNAISSLNNAKADCKNKMQIKCSNCQNLQCAQATKDCSSFTSAVANGLVNAAGAVVDFSNQVADTFKSIGGAIVKVGEDIGNGVVSVGGDIAKGAQDAVKGAGDFFSSWGRRRRGLRALEKRSVERRDVLTKAFCDGLVSGGCTITQQACAGSCAGVQAIATGMCDTVDVAVASVQAAQTVNGWAQYVADHVLSLINDIIVIHEMSFTVALSTASLASNSISVSFNMDVFGRNLQFSLTVTLGDIAALAKKIFDYVIDQVKSAYKQVASAVSTLVAPASTAVDSAVYTLPSGLQTAITNEASYQASYTANSAATGNVLQTVTTSSYQICRLKCQNTATCKGVTLTPSSSTCNLMSGTTKTTQYGSFAWNA